MIYTPEMSLRAKSINRKDLSMARKAEPCYETLPPEAISEELAPAIADPGLEENCRQLAMQGWTVIEQAASAELNKRLQIV